MLPTMGLNMLLMREAPAEMLLCRTSFTPIPPRYNSIRRSSANYHGMQGSAPQAPQVLQAVGQPEAVVGMGQLLIFRL